MKLFFINLHNLLPRLLCTNLAVNCDCLVFVYFYYANEKSAFISDHFIQGNLLTFFSNINLCKKSNDK